MNYAIIERSYTRSTKQSSARCFDHLNSLEAATEVYLEYQERQSDNGDTCVVITMPPFENGICPVCGPNEEQVATKNCSYLVSIEHGECDRPRQPGSVFCAWHSIKENRNSFLSDRGMFL